MPNVAKVPGLDAGKADHWTVVTNRAIHHSRARAVRARTSHVRQRLAVNKPVAGTATCGAQPTLHLVASPVTNATASARPWRSIGCRLGYAGRVMAASSCARARRHSRWQSMPYPYPEFYDRRAPHHAQRGREDQYSAVGHQPGRWLRQVLADPF